MSLDKPPSTVDRTRCAVHGLARGPDGRCVLCRREGAGATTQRHPARSARQRRAAGVAIGVALLGASLLAGFASVRFTRTSPTSAVSAAPAPAPTTVASEPKPVLREPIERPPSSSSATTPTASALAPPSDPEPPEASRDYLDEAWRALDRATLYGDPASAARRGATRRVLAILVPVFGRSALTANAAEVARVLFTAKDSTAARYRAASYGRVQITGSVADVVGPFETSEPADFCRKGTRELADRADAAAQASGVRLAAYDFIAYVIPPDMPCSWQGLGMIAGGRLWVKAATAKLFQHELGHTFGLDHAQLWATSKADPSDAMGSAGVGFNAPHIVQLGWLSPFPGKLVRVSGSTDLTLDALETDPAISSGPAVAVVRPPRSANTYYLSYRAPRAGESLPPEHTTGVNIHIFNGRAAGSPFTHFVRALDDGETYADGALVIRQSSHVTGQSVSVQIELSGGASPATAGAPPSERGSVRSAANGKCLSIHEGSSEDGAAVVQEGCHDRADQEWRVVGAGGGEVRIMNVRSELCIAVAGGATTARSLAIQSGCSSSESLWSLQTTRGGQALRGISSGLCLEATRGSRVDRAQLALWRCTGAANQAWRLGEGVGGP